MNRGIDSVKNTLSSVGLNVIWDVTDRLSLELDYHDSNSKAEPNSDLGSAMLLAITSPTGRAQASTFYGPELPVVDLTTTSGNPTTNHCAIRRW